jgi:hypothetical protein
MFALALRLPNSLHTIAGIRIEVHHVWVAEGAAFLQRNGALGPV